MKAMMKMTRLSLFPLLQAAGLALLLCACTSESTDEGLPEGTTPIRFQMPETRGVVNGAGDMEAFSVWGGYDNNATNVFNGTEVRYEGNAWTYTGTQYWIAGKNYDFYAVYPTTTILSSTNKCMVSYDETGNILKVTNFTADTNIPQQTDLLYALIKGINNANTGEAVALTFKHALTKLQFSAKLADGMDEKYSLTVHSVAVWATNTGTMTFPSEVNSTPTWATSPFRQDGSDEINPEYSANLYVLSSEDNALQNQTDITPSKGSVELTTSGYELLMVPQQMSVTRPVLAINYTLSYNGTSATPQWKQIPLGNTTTDWEPGESLNYTFVINDNNVYLQLTVADWEAGNAGNTDITFE